MTPHADGIIQSIYKVREYYATERRWIFKPYVVVRFLNGTHAHIPMDRFVEGEPQIGAVLRWHDLFGGTFDVLPPDTHPLRKGKPVKTEDPSQYPAS